MRTLIVSLIALAALGLAQRAEALRQVRVYEVNVSSQTDAAVQAQSGLRQVLVRATGARDAANDPALAGLLAQAQQYVIATRPAGTRHRHDAGIRCRRPGTRHHRGGPRHLAERTPAAVDRPHRRTRFGRIRDSTPGRGRARFHRQSPRPAHPRRATGSPESSGGRRHPLRCRAGGRAAAAAPTRSHRLRRCGHGRRSVALESERGSASAKAGAARWKMACMAPPTCSRATRWHLPPCPRPRCWWRSKACRRCKDYARVVGVARSAGGVRSVQLAEAAGTRATFSVVTRGGADSLQTALAANARASSRIDPHAGGTVAFRFRP